MTNNNKEVSIVEANEMYLNELKEIHKAMEREINEARASLRKKEDELAELGAKIIREELKMLGIKDGVTIIEYSGGKGVIEIRKRDRYCGIRPYYQNEFVKIKKDGQVGTRGEVIYEIEGCIKRGALKITNEEYNKEELS